MQRVLIDHLGDFAEHSNSSGFMGLTGSYTRVQGQVVTSSARATLLLEYPRQDTEMVAYATTVPSC